ncbi:MAG: PaaI family thioesterase [Gammaproteobacteria bacterium]|nr:PaaI family thioesterase [Gammaproteobacteria bacterium]
MNDLPDLDHPDNPFASEEITPAYSAEWDARRRVAAAIRRLTEVLVSSTPPIPQLHAIADTLELTADNFAAQPRIYGRALFAGGGTHGSMGQISHELNPVAGISNPLAPPLNVWFADGVTHGRATLGWAYEGPPGSVHGGFVAALFDQFMGVAQASGGQPGMTGTLSTRYHRRTPLNTELHFRGWVEKIEGRKTFVHAEIHAGEVLTASCDGVFVQPPGGMDRLHREYAQSPSGRQDRAEE